MTGNAFSLTGLSAGSYSNFSITNNGCTGSVATPVNLTDPAAPTLGLNGSTNPTTCGGTNGSISFTTTNLPNGTYSLTYTGAGSPKTVTVTGNAFSLTGLSAGSLFELLDHQQRLYRFGGHPRQPDRPGRSDAGVERLD